MTEGNMSLRYCLREPIPEIEIAARRLEEAVGAHLRGECDAAEELFRQADDKVVWDWLDSVWGKETVYNRPRRTLNDPPALPKNQRAKPRDAADEIKRRVHQHAAFQCMWAQYDHILPHARGGRSDLENVYLTCAACNYGRGNYLLEDFDLLHPSLHAPRQGSWNGLENFR